MHPFHPATTKTTRKKAYRYVALGCLLALLVNVVPLPVPFSPTAKATTYSPLNNYRPKDHAIFRKDGVWHVYSIYVCIDQTPPCDTTPKGLMHLTSTDLKNWTEVGYVVPPGTSGAWDDYDTWAPSVVASGGTYYMFYTGVDQDGDGTLVQKIGLATSTDLNTWTKSGSNPVVNCDDYSWVYYDPTAAGDSAACRDPWVMWDGSQWVMFFVANTTAADTMVTGYATSTNLTTWTAGAAIGGFPVQPQVESPHVIQHSGTNYLVFTDNCAVQPCIRYVSSTSLLSGYGSEAATTLEDNAYASEYLMDGGREYFTRVDGLNNNRFKFSELVWTGSPFTVQEISFGKVGDFVWSDTDGDGVQDGGEGGIDNVSVSLYLDDGDDVFSPATDDLYRTVTSGDDPNTGGTQRGYYQFTDVIPVISGDAYWVVIGASSFSYGGAVTGRVPTTATYPAEVTVSDNQTVSTHDIGFSPFARDYLNRQKAGLTTGVQHEVFFTSPSASGGAGNNKVILIFPNNSANNTKWCKTNSGTITPTGIANPTGASESATALPGTLAGTCTQSPDTFTITGVNNLDGTTKYGVRIAGNSSALGTGDAANSIKVNIKINNGTSDVGSTVLVLSLIAEDQVGVSFRVDPTLTVALSGNTAGLGTLSVSNVNYVGVTSTVSTNAKTGFVSLVKYDATLTSGSDTIGDSDTDVAPGTSEWGASTDDDSNVDLVTSDPFPVCSTTQQSSVGAEPATPLSITFQTFASESAAASADVTTLCFLAATSATQVAGTYTSTATLVTTARF